MFVTLVGMASNNMGSYLSIIKIVKTRKIDAQERSLGIIQLEMFEIRQGGVLENQQKPP